MSKTADNRDGKIFDRVASDDGLFAALAGALGPAELSERQRTSMRTRVLAAVQASTPPPLTETVRGERLPWHRVWPGVQVKVLHRDVPNNLQIMLFRMEPGGVVPGHTHTREEECLVLEGEVLVGKHRVGQGDLHIARVGARHPNLTTETGALIMVRSEIPPIHIG